MGEQERIVAISAPEKYLAVTWQVNNFCNYSCSYCNPGNWIGDARNETNLELYIENLNTLIDRYTAEGYKHFKFFFSGGEPTAWKHFLPICEHLRWKLPDCTIAINTNLSRPVKWWEKHHELFDDVVASFHVEFAKKEQYQETSIFLCDKMNYLSSKMLLHDERFWEVVEFGEHLKTVMPNYFIEWTPLYDEMTVNAGPWKYDDSDKEQFINEHSTDTYYSKDKPWKDSGVVSYVNWESGLQEPCNSNDVIIRRQNFFEGWDCDVGDCIFINPIGDITLASCGVSGKVGHILKDIDRVGPHTVSCNKHHCHCGTDIIIPKRITPKAEEIIAVGTD